MRYFIDTEFIEGFHKPLFGKKRHFIDLISIGIVAEDGREYYAISNEYDYNKASDWVKENVILPLYQSSLSGDIKNILKSENFHKNIGKSNKQIAQDIFEFCAGDSITLATAKHYEVDYANKGIEFYAYYADYDWVLFCSLFGTMMDLPSGFPMYCKDLKQTIDEKIDLINAKIQLNSPGVSLITHDTIKESDLTYPKQKNEHNALDDAKWNFELYNFLKSF